MERVIFLVEGRPDDLANFSGIPHFFTRALREQLDSIGARLEVIDTSSLLNVEELLASIEALRDGAPAGDALPCGDEALSAAKAADPLNRALFTDVAAARGEGELPAILAAYYAGVARRTGEMLAAVLRPGDVILSQNPFYPYVGAQPDVHYYLDARLSGFYFDPVSGVVPERRRHAGVVELYERLERDVLTSARRIFCFSDALSREFVARCGVSGGACSTAGAGINFDELPAPVPRRRRGVVKLLFVGLDFVRKGGPALLDVMERLSGEPIELTIVTGVEALSRIPGSARVVARPPAAKAELSSLYADADVFVFPTTFEPYGLVVCEAMAHGLPVVATRTPAMAEIVGPMGTPLLVEVNDVPALERAIRGLARDEPARRTLGAYNRLRAERFRWRSAVNHILMRLLEAGAAAP